MNKKTHENKKGSAKPSKQEITIDPYSNLFHDQLKDIDNSIILESYRRLQLIYDLGQKICAITDLEKLLKTIIKALISSISLERCFIAKFEETGKLIPLITHNIELNEDISKWPISKSVINKVLKEGLAILSSDTFQDERFSRAASVDLHNIRSVICTPLGYKDACTGIIYLDNTLKSGTFSEHDLHFLTALTHYIDLGIRNATELSEIKSQQQLSDERCKALQRELLQEHQIIGKSQKLLNAYEDLKHLAVTGVPIILTGETGTGKELFAKAAHKISNRAEKIFMPLNIADRTETMIESELFGHEKGVFTGAFTKRIGLLETANGGTLFLDEVSEIPIHIQTKLLRVLETGEFMRVGATKSVSTNVRLICATNKDLEECVRKNQFREDLYYRLYGGTIHIPPLCERSEDIPELIRYFLKNIRSKKTFSKSAMKQMMAYTWPGNVRLLQKVVEASVAMCEAETIDIGYLPPNIRSSTIHQVPHFPHLKDVLSEVEEKHFRRALELSKNNNDRAIKLLGISRATYFERKKRYKL